MFKDNIRSCFFNERVCQGKIIKPHWMLVNGKWHSFGEFGPDDYEDEVMFIED